MINYIISIEGKIILQDFNIVSYVRRSEDIDNFYDDQARWSTTKISWRNYQARLETQLTDTEIIINIATLIKIQKTLLQTFSIAIL